jgi:poly(3-hydroxybutyrate) depolymerase
VGFDDEKTLLNDPDIAALRTQARFGGILASARKNRSAGDAAVVSEGTFVAPQGRPVGILVVLHDRSSDPVTASGPFVNAAHERGLFVAVPRGPARAGKKRFGWGTKERALSAVAAALAEAKRRAGANLPVLLVGIGRGGTLAFTVAAHQAGTYSGVGSVGGPYDPGAGNSAQAPAEGAALRGARLFFGVTYDAPQGLVAEMGRGVDALKRMGLSPVFRNWPGAGETFPQNVTGAVKDTLDAMMGIR